MGAYPWVQKGLAFCNAVLTGERSAGQLVVLACERFRRDLERQGTETFPYLFDADEAERWLAHLARLKHVKGPLAGRYYEPSGWQCFCTMNLYGWLNADGRRRFNEAYIECPRGQGKALAIETPVPTIDGWKRHGDLVPGDVLFNQHGQRIVVEAVTEHFSGPCYAVSTTDGETIVAHEAHEWVTERTWFTGRRSGPNGGPLPPVETRDLRDTLRTTGARRDLVHRVPRVAPLELPPIDLPFPPYTLGAWLGDGTTTSPRLTCADRGIIDEIERDGFTAKKDTSAYGWGLSASGRNVKGELRALGVLGNKHIPAAYLRAGTGQRWALLQGLMDTDGYCNEDGQCEFTTTSEPLFLGFLELCMTLGLTPGVTVGRSTLYGEDHGAKYRVRFYCPTPVFRLERKAKRQRGEGRRRMFSGAEPVGDRVVNCIQVQGGVYLAGERLVPTHNSFWVAGLGLGHLTIDGEVGAEIYCLEPSTPVLMADCSWRPLSEVRAGDQIFAFDEHPPAARQFRKLRAATVESLQTVRLPSYRLTMADGRSVVCSADHRWLGCTPNAAGHVWKETAKIKPGFRILDLGRPWALDDSRDAGWLAGFYDGEGWLRSSKNRRGGRYRSGFSIGVSQNPGPLLDRARTLVEGRGYRASPTVLVNGSCGKFEIYGIQQCMRFLGEIAPQRLQRKALDWFPGMAPIADKTEVVAVEYLGERELIAPKTSTATLFANGLFSHNCGATSEKQAWEVFRPARGMCLNNPEFCAEYGVEVHQRSRALYVMATGSRFEPLIGVPGDGAAPSFAIVDEYHEHANSDQVDTMTTGMQKRSQPMMFVITTAGSDFGGPCREKRQDCVKILDGSVVDETVFAIIFTIDTKSDGAANDDRWDTVDALIKAQPGWFEHINREFILAELEKAKRNPGKQASYRTKYLDQWVGAKSAWMNMLKFQACGRNGLALERTLAEPGWRLFIGMDLASKIDLAVLAALFVRGTGSTARYRLHLDRWVPEAQLQDGKNKDRYTKWRAVERVNVTEGNVVDFDEIEQRILWYRGKAEVVEVGYDPWQATQLATHMLAEGVPMVEVPMTVRHISDPMKELEAVIYDGRFEYDSGDEPLVWQAGNVVAKRDKKQNVFPDKEREEAKIDDFVAALLAMNRALAAVASGKSFWEVA